MGDGEQMTAEDAQRLYGAQGFGDWRTDAMWGRFLALDQRVEQEMVRRIHRAEQRAAGKRQPVDKLLPMWVRSAYADLKPYFVAMEKLGKPTPLPFGKLLASELGRQMLEELIEEDRIDTLWALHVEEREKYLPLVRAQHAGYPPRARPELRAFFTGTQLWFHTEQREAPTGRMLALLTIATGIEPVEETLSLAVKRWDERLHRWRADLDTQHPGWRTAIPNIPK